MTKRMMKDALLELMQKQDLASISVTALCDAADVNRSTYYNYYTNPSDLLHEAEEDFLSSIPLPRRFWIRKIKQRYLKQLQTFLIIFGITEIWCAPCSADLPAAISRRVL